MSEATNATTAAPAAGLILEAVSPDDVERQLNDFPEPDRAVISRLMQLLLESHQLNGFGHRISGLAVTIPGYTADGRPVFDIDVVPRAPGPAMSSDTGTQRSIQLTPVTVAPGVS